jgi:prevent-host-death family protein
MRFISDRELANRSGAVIAAVSAGESFTVTYNGTPVAVLSPITENPVDLRSSRPAVAHGGFTAMTRARNASATSAVLDVLHAER